MKVRCSACSKPFDAQRSSAKFCGPTCRKRSSRTSPDVVPEPPLAAVPDVPCAEHALITATRRELEEADRLDTVAGQQAMRLAEKMASNFDTGSALAAVSKELSAVMLRALADAPKKADALDELLERRLRKASGA